MKRKILFLLTALVVGFTANAKTVTFDFTDPSSLGITPPAAGSGVNLSELALEYNGVTMTCVKNASNDTRIWGKAGPSYELRTYKSNTITFSASQAITAIEFDGTVAFSEIASGKAWTGNATSVTFTATGTNYITSAKLTIGEAADVWVPDTVSVAEALQLIAAGDTHDHYVYGVVRKEPYSTTSSTTYTTVQFWLESEENANDTLQAYKIAKADGSKWTDVNEANDSIQVGKRVLVYAEKLAIYTNTSTGVSWPEINGGKFCKRLPDLGENVVVRFYPPAGAPAAGIDIIGTFDEWSGTQLEEKYGDEYYYVYLDGIQPDDLFKFREAGTWDNEPTYYSSTMGNMTFSDYWVDGTGYGYPGYKMLWIDWRSSEYSWVTPAGASTYSVYVGFYSPSGAPENGVEIVGSFGWETGVKMAQEGNFYYTYLYNIAETELFKFREFEDYTWQNDLMYKDNDSWYRFNNFTFGKVWQDDVYNNYGADKYIILDLSDDNWYSWLIPYTPAADAPTADYLAQHYDVENNVVLCINFMDDATVCDYRVPYFVGNANNWGRYENNTFSWDNCQSFSELVDWPGWYVVSIPYENLEGGFQGKPVHPTYYGSFNWKFQPGDPEAWTYVGGKQADITANYAYTESNIVYPEPGAYIYELHYWKDHNNPCIQPQFYTYDITVKTPACLPVRGLAIAGDFNNWDQTEPMTLIGEDTYSITISAELKDRFQLYEAYDETRSNTIEYWNSEINDWSEIGDFYLNSTEQMVEYDLSNPDFYRWKICPEPQCYYTIEMQDSYGDGWNGAYIQVVDGSYSETFTMESGHLKTVEVPYYGNQVHFYWIKGLYDSETSFTIQISNGMGVYSATGKDLADGELFYTLPGSPCTTAPNPYVPQNLQVIETAGPKLYISWEAVEGVAQYFVTLVQPDGALLTGTTTNLNIMTDVLTMNGIYQIAVTSLDENEMILGKASVDFEVSDLINMPDAEVKVLIPSDCNMNIDNGVYLWYNIAGTETWYYTQMTESPSRIFTAQLEVNAPAFYYFIANTNDTEADNYQYTYEYTATTSQVCTEVQYGFDLNYGFNSYVRNDCNLEDHNYRVSNLIGDDYQGRVEFTWSAEDIAATYVLKVYDAETDEALFDTYVYGTKSYTWGFSDDLNGKTIYWTVQAVSPYYLPSVQSEYTLTLQSSGVTLESFSVSSTDNKSLDAEWSFNIAYQPCLVEIMYHEYQGVIVESAITDENSYHYDANLPLPGTYCVRITPVDDYDNVIGESTIYCFYLNAISDPIWDLEGKANEHELTFTWQKNVDKVYACLYQVDNNYAIVEQGDLTGTSVTYNVPEDGIYLLELQPYVEIYGEEVLVNAYYSVSVSAFTVETFHISLDASDGGYLSPYSYDDDLPENYVVEVYAYPYSGYIFEEWSDTHSTNPYRRFLVSEDVTATAIFARLAQVEIKDVANGTVDISDNYEYKSGNTYYVKVGTTITVNASADDGYRFVQWQEDGDMHPTLTVTIEEDRSFTPVFTAITGDETWHTIEVSVNDANKGYIKENLLPEYIEGTPITITAVAKEGYEFDHWEPNVLGTENPLEITMYDDYQITAFFERKQVEFIFYADPLEGGTITCTDANDMEVMSGIIADYGDVFHLVATPAEGYHFNGWSDNKVFAERDITLTEDKTLIARFEEDPEPDPVYYTLTVGIEGGNNRGLILFNDEAPEVIAGKYQKTFLENTEVTIKAVPAEGYEFLKYYEDGQEDVTTAEYTITLTSDRDILAHFKERETPPTPPTQYTFTLSKEGEGNVYSNPEPGTYDDGTEIQFVASCSDEYKFVGWTINGTTYSTEDVITIELHEDLAVIGYFEPKEAPQPKQKFHVTTKAEAHGSVSPKYTDEEIEEGTEFTLTATPDEGYKFVEWKEDHNEDAERTITVTKDITLTATFAELENFTLKVYVEPEGTADVSFNGRSIVERDGGLFSKSFVEGTSVTILTEPISGYIFLNYEEAGKEYDDAEYTVKMTKGHTVFAYLKKKSQDLENVEGAEAGTQKILRNGQIYILRGDKLFTITGQEVK